MVALLEDVDKKVIAGFCQRNKIKKLALFGSVARGDSRLDSDVDILVEFHPGCTPGLRFIDLQDQLSALFGCRRVDLVTEKFLNHRIRKSVLKESQVIFHEE